MAMWRWPNEEVYFLGWTADGGGCYNSTMTTITTDDIQRNLMGYLQRVKAGETLVVLEGNEPIVELKPATTNGKRLRPYALLRRQVSDARRL